MKPQIGGQLTKKNIHFIWWIYGHRNNIWRAFPNDLLSLVLDIPFILTGKHDFVLLTWKIYFSHVWPPENRLTSWIDAHINRLQPDSLRLFLSLTPKIWRAFSWGNLGRFTSTGTVQNLPEGTFGKLITSSLEAFFTNWWYG